MEAGYFAGAILILLFSVILHEVMHGLAALYFGDHTAERAGRLTLNPLPHIDPIGTILLPLLLIISGSRVLFGWAKPVPVNPLNFSNIRQGELVVSAAGVAINLVLALLGVLVFRLTSSTINPITSSLLIFATNINFILAAFNLLPIPPLDGSKVVASLLPHQLAFQYQQIEKYGFLILIMLWFIPIGNTSLLGAIMGLVLIFSQLLLGI